MSQLPTGHNKPEHSVADMHWGNDQLSRKPYADQLTRLIANTNGPYVIGLTSEWGSGKTFFLRAWQKQLREYGAPCVYVNAWETDHVEDPLVAFMGCVEQQLKDETGTETNVLFNKLNKNIGKLLKNTPKVFAKGFLKYICKKADYTPDEIESELFETVGENCINTFIDSMKEKEAFTASLEQLAQNVTQKYEKSRAKKQEDEKFDPAAPEKFPLLIMVDELDRCRPDYAIALLERIKHLFSVPGVVFLLAVDATQLLMLAEHLFGLKESPWRSGEQQKDATDGGEQQINATDARMEYLNKFFDIFYRLPTPDLQKFVKYALGRYCNLEKYDKIDENGDSLLINTFVVDSTLFKGKQLRTILQNIEQFSVFIKCYNSDLNEIFMAFFIIFTKQYKIYTSSNISQKIISNKDKSIIDLIMEYENLLGYNNSPESSNQRLRSIVEEINNLNYNRVDISLNLYIKCVISNTKSREILSFLSRKEDSRVTEFARKFDWRYTDQDLENRVQRRLALLENFSSTPM